VPPPYTEGPEPNGKRREATVAGLFLLLALTTAYLPETNQQQIAFTLRASVLRPFIATQVGLSNARRRAGRIDVLTDQLDSLSAILSTQAGLMDENRTLRALLGLAQRGGPTFVPASVIRLGTSGSEGTFIVDVGASDGIPQGAAVVGPSGLVGQISEVGADNSVGMDWSHPGIGVSAMLVDGSMYGIIETQRGRFRELDRLILSGAAYNTEVRPGTAVITSGLGGVFPRGIPIGRIAELLGTQGSWGKSYWIEPMVEPGSVTHVLVLTAGGEGDVSGVWPIDSLDTRPEAIVREPGS